MRSVDHNQVLAGFHKPTPIAHAKDIGFFDTEIAAQHEDATFRGMSAALYVRYHQLPDDKHHLYTIPARFTARHPGRKLGLIVAKKWFTIFQNNIMAIYFRGMQLLISKMGGLPVWAQATPNQRAEIYRLVWFQCKTAMATAMCGTCAGSFPIKDVFSDSSPEHVKWQTAIRRVFVYTCEQVYLLRILKDDKIKMYKWWKGIMFHPNFQEGGRLPLAGLRTYP